MNFHSHIEELARQRELQLRHRPVRPGPSVRTRVTFAGRGARRIRLTAIVRVVRPA